MKTKSETMGDRPVYFEIHFAVTEADLDELGHANNIAYLRWAQDVAIAHWRAAATERQVESIVWVAVRHEIDYLHPALPGDRLTARTRVGDSSGARFERIVEIRRDNDNRLLAKSRSVWAALDAATRRPKRVTDDLRSRFFAPLEPKEGEETP